MGQIDLRRSKTDPLEENGAACAAEPVGRSGAGGGRSVDRRRPAEVLVAQPEAVALEAEDLGVMNEPVDHRRGGHLVTEDLAPSRERLVRCTTVI